MTVTTAPKNEKTALSGDNRKMQIALKALELFAARGYDNTTVDHITEACGMSKGNFYYYFKTKEELVYLLRDWSVRNFDREIVNLEQHLREKGPTETLIYYFRVYLENVDQSMDAYNFLNHVIINLGPEGRRRLLQGSIAVYGLFEKILTEGIASGEFSLENPRLFAHNIARLGSAWAHNRWVFQSDMSLEQYIKQQTAYLLKTIKI